MAEAEHAFAEAVKREPENGLYRYNHGLALQQLGRRDEAMVEFRQAAPWDIARLSVARRERHKKVGACSQSSSRSSIHCCCTETRRTSQHAPVPLKVVGYYADWTAERYPLADIPADKLTHVNYAFGKIGRTTG